MKITIDTKEDSKHHIIEAIEFLRRFVQESEPVITNSVPMGNMLGMFADNKTADQVEQTEQPEQAEVKPEEKPSLIFLD